MPIIGSKSFDNLLCFVISRQLSAPKMHRDLRGVKTEIDTWYKIHARDLATTHDTMNLNSKFLALPEERLDILLTVKNTIKVRVKHCYEYEKKHAQGQGQTLL